MLGWEPTTRYVHDNDGRIIASRPEPEWDAEQQGWMLALAQLDADTCKGCGGALSETTAVNDDKRPAHQYVVPPPHRCFRCDALGKRQEAYEKADRPQALLWTVEEVTREH